MNFYKSRAMIKRLLQREKPQSILGHDIDKPRVTAAGWVLIFLYLGVPAMLLGGVIDFLVQQVSGQCLGIWCLFY